MTAADEGSRELAAAYEGLEDPRSFPDRGALEAYRRSLLDRTSEQAAFLAPHLGEQARVLEIGCGNGRLLVELAQSRIAFARAWAADEGLEQLQFEVADARDFSFQKGRFSAAVCLTGAF